MTTIKEIQVELARRGLYRAEIDGKLGPYTLEALGLALDLKQTAEPKWLTLARAEIGTMELAGDADAPKVVGYFRDAGHAEIFQDEVPWCAAFVGAMLERSGVHGSGSLMARSYMGWGVPLTVPRVGCVAVFRRGAPPSGHVGFYVGPVHGGPPEYMQILGGNQGDKVSVSHFLQKNLLGFRWPSDVALVA